MYLKNCRWLVGFVIYIVGNLINACALGLAPQSIITPLASINLVSNTAMAPFFLGERLTKEDIIATVIILTGCSIAVVFGSHEEPCTPLSLSLSLSRS